MKRITLLFIIVILSSFTAVAQSKYTISGYVHDAVSSEPLVGVSVSISPINSTYTNEYGFYSLIVNTSEVNIIYSYLSYNNKVYNGVISKDVELNMLLESSNITLNDVVVEAKTKNMVSTRALGSYSVDSKMLNYIPSFMGEKDIFKYFQILPGVNGGKEASSGVNLRGGSNDQTLILMDGIPIYNSAHAFGFTSIFNGNYIKSAELYKGYIPPQYGGRLSGVATMNIREGNRKKHSQQIQIGTTTASALVEGPIAGGRGSYLIGGRYFVPNIILGGMELFKDKDISSSYSNIGFYDATAKVSYDISNQTTLYGSFYSGNDALKFNDRTVEVFDTNNEGYSSDSKEIFSWGNIVGSVRLSSQLSNKSFLNANLYYSHISNRDYSDFTDSDGLYMHSSVTSQMGEAGLKADMKHNISSWYRLNYGLKFSYQHFSPQNIETEKGGIQVNKSYGNRTLYSANGYFDNAFTFGKLIVNLGGHLALYNNNRENKVVFEPRTALTYYMQKSSAWISYTVNTQPLFSVTQTSASFPLDYWVPFQKASELPSSKQISLGYKYAFDFGLDIQAETYYKQTDNLSIIHNVDDYLLSDGGYSIGTGDAYGAEFLMQYRKKRFNVMASYTYSRSKHHVGDKTFDFIYDTPHNLNVFTSYETLIKGAKTHTLSLNTNFKTGRPYYITSTILPMNGAFAPWYENLLNYPLYPNSRLTNFFRLDINYTMEKKLKRGSRVWQLSLLNATAHKNPYVVYFKQENNGDSKPTALTLIPILPSVSYTRVF